MDSLIMRDDNELIAEFMGLTWTKKSMVNYPNGHEDWDIELPGHFRIMKYGLRDHLFSKLPIFYHESWHWIMPVVEKIETLDHYRYGFTIDPHGVMCLDYALNEKVLFQVDQQEGDSKIRIVYESVLEFIKMYTTKQQEQKQL